MNILLADDHRILRTGLKLLLASQDDCHVVAEASNGQEVLECLEVTPVDVVLLDLSMPVMNGVDQHFVGNRLAVVQNQVLHHGGRLAGGLQRLQHRFAVQADLKPAQHFDFDYIFGSRLPDDNNQMQNKWDENNSHIRESQVSCY